MNGILEAGIENILWLQQFQTDRSYFFWDVFTNFGGSYYLYMVPALLWSVDYRMGLRLLLLLTATLILNSILKEAFAAPRPFELDARIVSSGEIGYGLPSGHAQLAVVFWGVLADWIDRKPFWILAFAMMFLMGLSRLVLGVHFPTDVLAGWFLGGVTLWLYRLYRAEGEAWLGALSRGRQLGLVTLASAGAFLATQVVARELNVLGAGAAGFVLGGGFGAVLGLHLLGFRGDGPVWQRGARFLIGIPVLLLFLVLVGQAGIPEGWMGMPVVALELTILGSFLAAGGPWLFQLLRLSSRPGF